MKKFRDLNFDLAACRRRTSRIWSFARRQPRAARTGADSALLRAAFAVIGFRGIVHVRYRAGRIALPSSSPFSATSKRTWLSGIPEEGTYCFVEFEDGGEDGVFSRSGEKATREWSRRFEHGFSQLVDWFYLLDDMKNTQRRRRISATGIPAFMAFWSSGGPLASATTNATGSCWRSDRVLVNSHKIVCLTYDDLYHALRRRIELYSDASEIS